MFFFVGNHRLMFWSFGIVFCPPACVLPSGVTWELSHSNTVTSYDKQPCVAAQSANLCSFIALP